MMEDEREVTGRHMEVDSGEKDTEEAITVLKEAKHWGKTEKWNLKEKVIMDAKKKAVMKMLDPQLVPSPRVDVKRTRKGKDIKTSETLKTKRVERTRSEETKDEVCQWRRTLGIRDNEIAEQIMPKCPQSHQLKMSRIGVQLLGDGDEDTYTCDECGNKTGPEGER